MISIALLLMLSSSSVAQGQTAATAEPLKPPKPAMRQNGLIGASPYPADALRMKQEGTTVLALHVTARGRVSSCTIAKSSGTKSLDDASCAFARRLKFDPAVAAGGQAVEADTRFPMAWHLPR
ncbi:energy transducer TonB [Sphingomonas sp. Mn802worker]|uniref:energy transducer TonB n=1 Tax=Sphingomonas sp. Mn802worker TaxID=629773 RepID=UPI0009FF3EAA